MTSTTDTSSSATSSMSGMAVSMATQAMDAGEKAIEAASQAGTAVASTAREYPVTTGLVIAGVAFALGALWKSGSWRRRSGVAGYVDRMNETLSDMPRRLRNEWR